MFFFFLKKPKCQPKLCTRKRSRGLWSQQQRRVRFDLGIPVEEESLVERDPKESAHQVVNQAKYIRRCICSQGVDGRPYRGSAICIYAIKSINKYLRDKTKVVALWGIEEQALLEWMRELGILCNKKPSEYTDTGNLMRKDSCKD